MTLNDLIMNWFPFLVSLIISFTVFGLMFFAKKPVMMIADILIRCQTKSGSNARNSVAGFAECCTIAEIMLLALNLLFGLDLAPAWGAAAGAMATLEYLFYENIKYPNVNKSDLDEALTLAKETIEKAVGESGSGDDTPVSTFML